MNARTFTYYVRAAANARSAVRTPYLIEGPSLIAHMQYTFSATASPPNASLELGLNGQDEADVAVATKKPYDPVQEHLRGGNISINAELRGFLNLQTEPRDVFLKMPVYIDAWRLTVALINTGAGALDAVGYVKIWEAVPPELLECFID